MSHIIAWAIFLPGAFLGVLAKCCIACNDEYTYNQSRLIHQYQKIEEEVMAKKIEEVAKNYAEENVGFFFNEPRKIEEWNKTALIKVMDHKKKNSDGEVAPVLSPLDYFSTVRTVGAIHSRDTISFASAQFSILLAESAIYIAPH